LAAAGLALAAVGRFGEATWTERRQKWLRFIREASPEIETERREAMLFPSIAAAFGSRGSDVSQGNSS